MGEQTASGYSIKVEGLDTCLAVLTKAGAQLFDLDTSQVRLANSQLRFEAKQLAERFGADVVAPLVREHGGGIGEAMAETIRPKADRLPIVRIGATNPTGLSGWKGTAKRNRAVQRGRHIDPGQWKGSLAYGSEFGPHPQSRGNRYGRPRNSGGYVLGPRMAELTEKLGPMYVPLLVEAFTTAGWPVDDKGTV